MPTQRDSYVEVGSALRTLMQHVSKQNLRPRQWRVLAAIIERTAGWSRLSEQIPLKTIAEETQLHLRDVRTLVRELDALNLIVYQPGSSLRGTRRRASTFRLVHTPSSQAASACGPRRDVFDDKAETERRSRDVVLTERGNSPRLSDESHARNRAAEHTHLPNSDEKNPESASRELDATSHGEVERLVDEAMKLIAAAHPSVIEKDSAGLIADAIRPYVQAATPDAIGDAARAVSLINARHPVRYLAASLANAARELASQRPIQNERRLDAARSLGRSYAATLSSGEAYARIMFEYPNDAHLAQAAIDSFDEHSP